MKNTILKVLTFIVMLAMVINYKAVANNTSFHEMSGDGTMSNFIEFEDSVRWNFVRFRTTPMKNIVGAKLVIDNSITIPKGVGASNRRLILTPFVIDCQTEDTIKILDPVVLDGKKYKSKSKNDPYAPYVDRMRTLNENRFDVSIFDTVIVPDAMRTYYVSCNVMLKKKNKNIYENNWILTNCKVKRPLQFLELSLPKFHLIPNKYKEKPRREKLNVVNTISLTFLPNKAELNGDDLNNDVQLAQLQSDLMEIVNGEGSMLKALKVIGVSSPEGNYAANLSLAKRRTSYMLEKIKSMIPSSSWNRIFIHKPETRVAAWDEMADLLERDALLDEAAEIRTITAKYKSHDDQYARIRNLPFYSTVIKERLPQLRKMEYEYEVESFRALKPNEILSRYQNDPKYRDGKKAFSRYEYWHLFQLISDPKEAEKIYRRAYNEHMEVDDKGNKRPWMLAANYLAVSLLKRDTFDVEILKPFIDYTRPINSIERVDDGLFIVENEINQEDVVANQVAMYILANDFENARILADKLPKKSKFNLTKAFVACLGGYYDYRGASSPEEFEERREIVKLVKESSPMNHAVMCMAMETPFYDKEAKEVLDKMEQTTKVKYMKLQLFIRENGLYGNPKKQYPNEEAIYKEACLMLDAIIKEDPKYRRIAEHDGEITKEFMEYFAESSNWNN